MRRILNLAFASMAIVLPVPVPFEQLDPLARAEAKDIVRRADFAFQTNLQTWTTLDSAILSFVAKPFRPYIRHRQDEFIAYINGNIALFGEFADLDPREFEAPLKREGDPIVIHDYERIFSRKMH